jgi:hypothetical protein
VLSLENDFVGEETFLKERFLPVFFCYLFKKGSTKNFHTESFSAHSGFDHDVSTNQSIKVLIKLFQKLVGS